MGVQLPIHLRRKKPPKLHLRLHRVMLGGATSGYTIDRIAPKGHGGTVHTREDREAQIVTRYAGSAFSWWTGMTPAEREVAIAKMVAENECTPRHRRGKRAALKQHDSG